jgi:hypothetical protein
MWVKRGQSDRPLASRGTNVIRVFWLGLALGVAASIAAFVLTAAKAGSAG